MTTTANHLRTIALHWTDLHEAAGQPAQLGAFGLGLRGYLARLDEADAEQLEYERHQAAHLRTLERDPIQLGERPVPVRLAILDTMRIVETVLVQCADDIAHAAQRHPMAMPRAQRAAIARTRAERLAWEDRARQIQQAKAELVDPRRWRYTGRRTAPYAALWLLARVEHAPGPCRRLTEDEERKIGKVAEGAAERVERALDIAARVAPITEPCPYPSCGGRIEIHGGAGATPVAHCTKCGHIWSEQAAMA
ncbi:BRcat domain-containing protein [Streptomyces albicerus]|uniref:BRcat domain-containing protein n=1 Tax=Streptomyces albicerus TaxID=2569859 RepID=UPI00124B9863|nr:IBR domain-containing protein [Streptomyces albicerus]